MGYLLLPADEQELVIYLTTELGLRLLLNDLAPDGVPKVATDPLAALPGEIPPASGPAVRDLVFWCPDDGPIRTLGTAVPEGPVDQVLLELNRERNAHWRDLLDYSRSPVLWWRRCHWTREGYLAPGLLGAMTIPQRRQPPGLLDRLKRATSWLRTGAERLNPFEHCSRPSISQPANLGPFWVWARPHALAWVQAGGEVWPWNA